MGARSRLLCLEDAGKSQFAEFHIYLWYAVLATLVYFLDEKTTEIFEVFKVLCDRRVRAVPI